MTLMTPLDLLAVSSQEQDIIRCLVRRSCLTLQEIAGVTRIPMNELEPVVNKMVQESRLNKDDDSKFQVLLHNAKPKRERTESSLLDSLFN